MRTVYLIGARASGKTSLGRELARTLGRPFADTDHLFVQLRGVSIADYVAEQGWEAFRDAETEALRAAADPPGAVAACGGGIVLRPANRDILATGLVLYLHAPAEVLARRLGADPLEAQRPSLTGEGIADEVHRVLAQREGLYRDCADAVLDATAPPQEVLQSALDVLDAL